MHLLDHFFCSLQTKGALHQKNFVLNPVPICKGNLLYMLIIKMRQFQQYKLVNYIKMRKKSGAKFSSSNGENSPTE